nr:helicase-like protein [Tanacetum cinerariifolium]GEW73878.1 helicase-like protein [Tanacetum cinerariifolium]
MEHADMSMEASHVIEPVVQTGVPKPSETEIESQILTAFEPTDVDVVLNPTVATVDEEGLGSIYFSCAGGIYHRIDQLVPRDGEPRYLQLYFYDAESEFEHRLKWPNIDREIVTILSRVLAQNPYVQTFRSIGNLGPFDNYKAGWYKRIPREGVDIRELVDDDDDGAEDDEGPRNMRKRFLDAMVLVQDAGKPGIFLTMTFNLNWPEIMENLYEGQTTQDRPYLVTRVFRAKLEYLKYQLFTRHILDVVASHIYVIEFQKQGLPHAHFLLIMRSSDKLENVDHYDKVVCAKIPDPNKHHELHQLVIKHMIHDPCGHLNTQCPCMKGEPKKCHWTYTRQFHETMHQRDDSYPLYRQRENGNEVNVRNNVLDNRWVVPYNSKLLMMFNCHINVEVCSSIKSVKYVFKFTEDDELTDILEKERNKRSMLTAFFKLNQTDTQARQYLYKDIPKYYTWNKSTCKWSRPTGFDYLYMVNDVLYTTFHKAALEMGLIKSDDYIHACLQDYNLDCSSVKRVQNMVLTDISAILQSMGKSLSDFDLPNINADVRSYPFGCREVHEECSIVVQAKDILARHSLNIDQKNAYDTIMRHVDADSPGVFFIDGPRGPGKTFLYKALLATIRSRGLIALATASSGAAANNMTGGTTAHSRFKIPNNLTTNSICNIKKQSGLAKLLCQATLIIWDEASMAKRQAVEAIDRTMQDVNGVKLPFGGKIMVL